MFHMKHRTHFFALVEFGFYRKIFSFRRLWKLYVTLVNDLFDR